jgi:hypothetical protein
MSKSIDYGPSPCYAQRWSLSDVREGEMHFDYFLILDAENWQSLFPWPYQGYSLMFSLFVMKETKVPNPHFDKILPFIFYGQRVYRSEERIRLFTKFLA